MRVNQYVSHATGISRRAADRSVSEGRVRINGAVALPGVRVSAGDQVELDSRPLSIKPVYSIMLHKPVGYTVSRAAQGSQTVYDLLPAEFSSLKPAGRLDKDSSGLQIMSSDGQLIYELTHPSAGKWKTYRVTLNKPLTERDFAALNKGVELEDGLSRLQLTRRQRYLEVKLREGRNRQIRRSFAVLGYKVVTLHRCQIGNYRLGGLKPGQWRKL